MIPTGPFPNRPKVAHDLRCFRFAGYHGEETVLRLRLYYDMDFIAMDFFNHCGQCCIPAEIMVVVNTRDAKTQKITSEYTMNRPTSDLFWFPYRNGFRVYYMGRVLIFGDAGLDILQEVKDKRWDVYPGDSLEELGC